MAAVITARLCTYIRNALDCPIDRIVCWTDNSSTFHWIHGSLSQWKKNRIEILPWTNVPTRGMSSSELKERQL